MVESAPSHPLLEPLGGRGTELPVLLLTNCCETWENPLPGPGTKVRSLTGELRLHMSCGQKKQNKT